MTALRPLLLGAALALLSAAPARCDLTFADGAHADAARAVWAQLPACFHRLTGRVSETGEDAWQGEGWRKGMAGAAWPDGPIELRASCWDAAYLLHEAGHAVWWQILTDADRAEWSRFWAKHLKAMPREYARSDASEGWADSFSIVYSPPNAGSVNLGGVGPGVTALIRRLAEK